MAYLLEAALSGRSRCRGCGAAIAKGSVRFGELLPNPYGEGDTAIWYHPICAAYRRPHALLQSLAGDAGTLEAVEDLRVIAELSHAHRRLCRLGGVERASSGRARCRACRELIARDLWRIPLWFHEEGMYNVSGFVHLTCAPRYFETAELMECIGHFQPGLTAAETAEITEVLRSAEH